MASRFIPHTQLKLSLQHILLHKISDHGSLFHILKQYLRSSGAIAICPVVIKANPVMITHIDKEALVILFSSLQDQLVYMQKQLDTANERLSDNNKQIELLTEQIR